MNLAGKRVLITGTSGFLGRHVCAAMESTGATIYPFPRRMVRDLRSVESTGELFAWAKPQVVVHLAAHCGGIGANQQRPGDMLADNALMAVNVLEACRQFQVEKLVTVGSVCGYPERPKTIPFVEAEYLDGQPEPTNAPYGTAKRLLLSLCQAYRQQHDLHSIYLILANLYGPGDHFDPETSHCIPGIIRRITDTRENSDRTVTLWGTGRPTRDFLHVRDAARAIVLAAEHYDGSEPVNIGTGRETSVRDVAERIAALMDWWQGEIIWDATKPDGQPRRVLDTRCARDRFSFRAEISLADGLAETVTWYASHRTQGATV